MSYETIIPLAFIEIIGDFALERYANHGGLLPFSLGIGGYMGVVYFLIQALKGSSILLVNGAWDGVSTLIESAAAYIILGERFHNYSQYVGLGLLIIGLYLLKIPKTKKEHFLHQFTIKQYK